MADDSRLLKLEVISPDRTFFTGDSDFVELRTTEGEIGIYKDHIPMTYMLSPGFLKIHKGTDIKTAVIHNGFIEIRPDHIVILAEACEWPGEIDLERAHRAAERAEKRLASGDPEINIKRAELALRKALMRIEAAEANK